MSKIKILLLYVGAACLVLGHLLTDPARHVVALGPREQAETEWLLVHGTRLFGGGPAVAEHPLLGLSVPAAPLTMLLGPGWTFTLLAICCLAGTAYAWFLLLDRHLVRHRLGAVLGGAIGGFAPGIVSHAQGDLALAAQFLVPIIVWRALGLRSGPAVRNGLVLGALCAWQALISVEMLILIAVLLAGYGAFRFRRPDRSMLIGLGVAGAVLLVSSPLWSIPPRAADVGSTVVSFVRFSTPTLATFPVGQVHYALAGTEQNTFFGWPLLTLLAVVVFWLRRRLVWALAGTGVLLGLLALGAHLRFKSARSPVPGPWALLRDLPVLDRVEPTHLALMLTPLVAVLVGLAVRRAAELRLGVLWVGLLTAALLPITPTPVKVFTSEIPAFITTGDWREYVPADRTLLVVPALGPTDPADLRWATATDLELTVADARMVRVLDPASVGREPKLTAEDRATFADRLRAERVAAVALAPGRYEVTQWQATRALLGADPDWVGGVWIWRVEP